MVLHCCPKKRVSSLASLSTKRFVCITTLSIRQIHINRKTYMHLLHIVYNVFKMSEPEKRTPISVYLTPRAAMVLKEYSEGSGYGSLSRTVEEIILAFDFTYNMVKDSLRTLATKAKNSEGKFSTADRAILWAAMVAALWNMDNAISRLNKKSRFP